MRAQEKEVILEAKKILHINLSKREFEVRSIPDYIPYLGGLGMGLKAVHTHKGQDPVIFAVGPLNGFFPFVSKTSIVFLRNGVPEDIYLGGGLSFRIRFSGLDGVILLGESKEPVVLNISDGSVAFEPAGVDVGSLGLPGRRSFLDLTQKGVLLDGYFTTPGIYLAEKLVKKQILSMVFTGTKTFEILNEEKYFELYHSLLKRASDLLVEKGANPSCSGCPLGCEKSRGGEMGGNVLVHSLTACGFAEPIYADVGTVFSCLNVLGYDYRHEDLENLPVLVERLLGEFSK